METFCLSERGYWRRSDVRYTDSINSLCPFAEKKSNPTERWKDRSCLFTWHLVLALLQLAMQSWQVIIQLTDPRFPNLRKWDWGIGKALSTFYKALIPFSFSFLLTLYTHMCVHMHTVQWFDVLSPLQVYTPESRFREVVRSLRGGVSGRWLGHGRRALLNYDPLSFKPGSVMWIWVRFLGQN